MLDPSLIGPASMAVTQAIGTFNTFLPKLTDIRKAVPEENPEFVNDVRVGEIAAVCVAVGVGAVVSYMTGSPVPAILSAFIAVGMVLLYESTLRTTPSERIAT